MSERAAGRELDIEVSERVLGVRWKGWERYSTDFAAAHLVLSEMNRTGYRVRVTFSAIVTVEWERMHEDASWEMIAEVEHDDFPMAVCLAALEGRAVLSSSSGQGAE